MNDLPLHVLLRENLGLRGAHIMDSMTGAEIIETSCVYFWNIDEDVCGRINTNVSLKSCFSFIQAEHDAVLESLT